MIGNDIVDLALAETESNWRRRGFIEKIFTGHERKLIEASANKEHAIWNLWSRKEAVYKIYSRKSGVRAFIPQRIKCLDVHDSGKVLCNGIIYHTRTSQSNEQVHTIALEEDDFDDVIILPAQLKIQKIGQLPFISDQYGDLLPISISHHGRFSVAVAKMVYKRTSTGSGTNSVSPGTFAKV
ncbi:MAG TPA: 4'-phosphopantetheinyl transferase superfamily protein [Flavobacterium sp.]|jgi:phosphopantetheinyl transferase (holo-ACP synthase)